MKEVLSRRTFGVCVGLFLALVAGAGANLWALGDEAKVSWYSGGNKLVSLEPVPAKLEYSLPFAGTTTMKTLVVYVQKDKQAKKNSTIPLQSDGSFNVQYLFNEGPGDYTVTIYGNAAANSLNYNGIGYFSVTVTQAVPAKLPGVDMNRKVLDFVDAVMGTQVGRGECWDLAQQALDKNGADWVRTVQYGRLLDPLVDEILPGDLMQFYSVKITEYPKPGSTRWETLGAPDHTAVVYEVLGPLRYKLAHQNLGGKRFVMVTDLNLNNMTSGKYWIYRPMPRLILASAN